MTSKTKATREAIANRKLLKSPHTYAYAGRISQNSDALLSEFEFGFGLGLGGARCRKRRGIHEYWRLVRFMHWRIGSLLGLRVWEAGIESELTISTTLVAINTSWSSFDGIGADRSQLRRLQLHGGQGPGLGGAQGDEDGVLGRE